MDPLITSQLDLYVRLEKAKVNFKKSPKERLTKEYLEGKLELLEQLWFEFSAGHKEIMRSAFSAERLAETKYVKDDIHSRGEDTYFEYKLLIKSLLNKFVDKSSDPKASTSAQISSDNNTSANVKLPKVNIPVFSGRYSEWNTFRDLFQSLIHSNKNLGNAQKLLYLKGYLQGEAEQLLCNIPITDNNYERCWQLLEERYNNKRYICHHILSRLLGQRNITCESASGLKSLMDTTNDCLSALSNIGVDTTSWDVLIIHVITLKLDPESRRQWEFSIMDNKSNELPTFKQFIEFLNNRYRAIEFLDSGSKPIFSKNVNSKVPVNKMKSMHITTINCPFCKEEHKLSFCKRFKDSSVESRREFVASNNICFCCLGNNHSAKFCHSSYKCHICKRKHHTLLHPLNKVSQEPQHGEVTADNHEEVNAVVSCTSTRNNVKYSQVLLATALVDTISKYGQTYTLRALLDQGSQSSFITEAMVQLLGLKKIPVKGQIIGVGGTNGLMSKSMVEIKLTSRVDSSFIIVVKAHVLGSITSLLPTHKITAEEWKELDDIVLADPSYYASNGIDLLLGSEVYSRIIQNGVMKGPRGSPLAQCTSLGWILSGAVHTSFEPPERINVMYCSVEENQLLKKFWELEDDIALPKERMYTEDEKTCEEYFNNSTRRDDTGRYIVRLPVKGNEELDVKNSLQIAERRLLSLERRLKNSDLKEKYKEVINEYVDMDHMERVPVNEIQNPKAIYLPHHVVIRDDKDTTKVRVVFDASCKGSNGKSLNDSLLVGPTLQSDLRHIVMRWRNHPICLSADIVKMYRQVKVDEGDVDYQRILWRDNVNAEIIHYRLLRVTFGVASAPYLAVKSLQQVALDEGKDFPLAAEKILSDFYMDDLMTGCETVDQGIKLYREMNEILARGGFELQKWTTNNEDLLKEIKEDSKNMGYGVSNEEKLRIKTDEIIKIVGITWDRSQDVFRYRVDVPSFVEPATKRKIISDICRFYDPLGWAGPIIILAKILIQKLWLAGIDWDETVPNELLREWLTYREELVHLQKVVIPRWTGVKTGDLVELHGFCDASKDAFAAVVYSRVVDSEGNVTVTLLSAKSKVAPIKQVSIPRLELCGAVLLCRLLTEVASVMNIDKTYLHAWTDSMVVLAWLNSSPKRWKVFVANRVSEIITNLDSHHWSHVSTKCNPADVASRGMQPSDLVKNAMWFQGPEFLHEKNIEYKKPRDIETNLEIIKIKSCCTTVKTVEWERFSTLSKLIRVVAYCKRFINNLRKQKQEKTIGFLNTVELKNAMNLCIQKCQEENFKDEIEIINKKQNLPKRSSLRSLNPFLDEDKVLRIGGRLENTIWSQDRKHPILMPKRSYLTGLIIGDAHKRTLHGGPQLMMGYIQTKYWIPGLKQLVKTYFKKCVTCVQNANKTQTQLMGQLPSARVTPTRPFKSSGVDYAGPIQIRTAKGRGHKSHKGYICLFVCMVTRAIHLEVVSDLTTEGFLQAFKRFTSRRGHCSDIWSDNATNFVGAANELKKLFAWEKGSMLQEVAEVLATNGCTWHFIPSHSPNFGGLWESGVKSVKYHLKRIVGQSTLTFEEMVTVLAQIEACLNSRPLSVITENDNTRVLTPGHFLVGEALVTPPDFDFQSSNISSLRRWQYAQRMIQDFWRQWSRQYLTKYFQRYRWSEQNPEPKINDVVLVKEDNLPACRWLYGRVIEVHPGSDNIVRVVTLKVKNSIVKRSVSKICPLPIAD